MCLLSLVWRGFCLLLFLPEQAQAEALDDILRTTDECVTQVRGKASPSSPPTRPWASSGGGGGGTSLRGYGYVQRTLTVFKTCSYSHSLAAKKRQRVGPDSDRGKCVMLHAYHRKQSRFGLAVRSLQF